jgi:hypothetical protein
MFDRDKDHAMFSSWCDAHGASATPAALLPPLGVVVQMDGQDSAALFLYYALSCPVAFLDCAATRPHLPLKDAIRCFDFAITFLKREAQQDGYGLIMCHASKAVSRVLGRIGFDTAEEGMVRTFSATYES